MSIGRIGLIGAGNMGGAFVRGWLKADPTMAARITVTDAVPAAAQRLAAATGIWVANSNKELAETCSLILLAVKPPDVETALAEAIPLINEGKMLVSCVAGRTTASLEVLFSTPVPVCRLMPNVAVAVGAGTICFAAGANTTPEMAAEVMELFAPLGQVVPIGEKLFSAATAIGGSGPGFLALMTDAFIDAGVMAGLTAPVARDLTLSMMSGTAKLLVEEDLAPDQLRRRVTSPAGTTAAGIAQMERDGVRSAIIDAVQAAVKRADELG